jgi:hypothetical protein
MRARWWTPAAGQFLTVDRLEYFDATSTLWGWGSQSPLRWNDPTGHCGGACVGAVVGFLGGAIYGAATADTSNFSTYAANVASYAAAGAVGGFIGGAGGAFAGTLLGGGTAAEGLAAAFGAGAITASGGAGATCTVTAQPAAARAGVSLASAVGVQATLHGAERLAERGFTPDEIASALSQDPLNQGDNAKVFIVSLSNGNYNVIVSGANGVVTALKNIDADALARLAVRYGWSP